MPLRTSHCEASDIQGFIDILNCPKLRDLKRLCKNAILHSECLVGLILAAGTPAFPYLHAIRTHDYVPEQLDLTEGDLRAMGGAKVGLMSSDVAKAFNKVSQAFDQRRQLVGHMFYTPDHATWHFLYFDQRDSSAHKNHWEAGPHIHLINSLWPNRTMQGVWDEFETKKVHIAGAEHLRFIMNNKLAS